MKKLIHVFFILMPLFFLFSCGMNLNISAKDGIASIKAEINPGKAVFNIFGNAAGFSSENPDLFNADEIKAALEESGFSRVIVQQNASKTFFISFDAPENDVPFIQSDGKILYSKAAFKKFYEQLPEKFQSMIDMLMAPVFTDEVITDEEYLDVLGSVYGEELENELKSSYVIIQEKKYLPVKILNMNE